MPWLGYTSVGDEEDKCYSRKKPVVIEAHQWHQNGDHPGDFSDRDNGDGLDLREGMVVRRFRSPDPGVARPQGLRALRKIIMHRTRLDRHA